MFTQLKIILPYKQKCKAIDVIGKPKWESVRRQWQWSIPLTKCHLCMSKTKLARLTQQFNHHATHNVKHVTFTADMWKSIQWPLFKIELFCISKCDVYFTIYTLLVSLLNFRYLKKKKGYQKNSVLMLQCVYLFLVK